MISLKKIPDYLDPQEVEKPPKIKNFYKKTDRTLHITILDEIITTKTFEKHIWKVGFTLQITKYVIFIFMALYINLL